jgi:hypothetical protein
MIIFNEIVMHATGKYAKFTGATLNEKALSSDPNYVAEITVAVPTLLLATLMLLLEMPIFLRKVQRTTFASQLRAGSMIQSKVSTERET